MDGIGGGALPGLPSVGGSFWTCAGLHLRGGFPPGPGRGRGRVLRTLRVVELLRCHGVQRPGGPPSSAAGPAGTGAGWHLPRGFPPGPGRGIQAFSRESPDAKSRGGMPPAPPFFIARSFPLARFGVVGRSGAIVGLFRGPGTCPDLDSHFAGAGFGGESISWRGIPPTKASPPGVRLWVGKPSFRVSDTCRPTDSPGRAHPAGPGGSPQKDPKGPTNLSAQRTRPVGHASQSSAGRSRRKRMQSCFDRLRRPKHTSQPPVCPQGARSGCIPQFWEGPHTKQNIRHPRTLPSRTKLSPRLPLPKFPS